MNPAESPLRIGERVIYRNNQFLALNKPAGLPTQPDPTGDSSLLQLARIYARCPLFVTHRIDRPASGIVLFAKTERALQAINEQFRNRTVRKSYLAVVANPPSNPEGYLYGRLIKDGKANRSMVVGPETAKGVESVLHYKMLGQSDYYALLEIDLFTGRHHQIRAQLAAAGCPIRGDVKYGFKRGNKDRSIQLHAWKLAFVHPVSQEMVQLEAPVPEEPLWDYFRPFCEKATEPPTQSKE